MATAKAQVVNDVIYEIVTGDRGNKKDVFRITIPSNYKITYGKIHAGGTTGGIEGNVLRIYEAENKQRAVFRDVVSFRDIGLQLVRKIDNDEGNDNPEWVVVN